MTLLGSAAPAAKLASSATPASTRRERRNIENLDVSVGKLKKAAYCNIFALFPAAWRPGAADADAASPPASNASRRPPDDARRQAALVGRRDRVPVRRRPGARRPRRRLS